MSVTQIRRRPFTGVARLAALAAALVAVCVSGAAVPPPGAAAAAFGAPKVVDGFDVALLLRWPAARCGPGADRTPYDRNGVRAWRCLRQKTYRYDLAATDDRERNGTPILGRRSFNAIEVQTVQSIASGGGDSYVRACSGQEDARLYALALDSFSSGVAEAAAAESGSPQAAKLAGILAAQTGVFGRKAVQWAIGTSDACVIAAQYAYRASVAAQRFVTYLRRRGTNRVTVIEGTAWLDKRWGRDRCVFAAAIDNSRVFSASGKGGSNETCGVAPEL